MDVRAVLDGLTETVTGRGAPGTLPRWPRWLRRYGERLLLLLTIGLAFAARASVQPAGVLAQLVAVLGAVPLALLAVRPLIAWRVSWLAALLSEFAPVPHENAWPWAPVTIIVFLPVLFAVAATQRLAVTIWVWLGTAILVSTEANRNNQAGILVLITLLVLAGDQVRRRARAQRELAEEEERSAVLAERTRIARELHDVVAHHMSMIAVRAETAPYRLGELAEPAREEFGQISAAAREALTEMRRLLGVLRSEQHEVPVAPQPGLADLAELVEGARRAGATIELSLPPDLAGVPPAVELTAYRIVQEALSNAGQHAPGAPAAVALARTGDALTVTVSNGPPAARPVPAVGPGHGLLGMRERAAMLGGELSAGRSAEGGFLVHAVLPLAGGER